MHLIFGDIGNQKPQTEGCGDEKSGQEIEKQNAALGGDVENGDSGDQKDGQLDVADQYIGQDFSDHELSGFERGYDELFEGASLSLPNDGEGGQENHGQGEDCATDAGYHEEGGHEVRVVPRTDSDVNGGLGIGNRQSAGGELLNENFLRFSLPD